MLSKIDKDSREFAQVASNLLDNVGDAAKYGADLTDSMDLMIEDLTALHDSLDMYYPDLQASLDDLSELVNRTTDAMNKGISTMTIVQNTLKATSGDIDEAAKNSLRGSMELLDKSLSILDTAGRTMKDVMDEQLDKFDTDNRFLFIDPSEDKVSFTSDKNPAPKTLQVVLRTDEISLDDEDNKETDAETEKVNEGPLKRMWNVLVQMWKAIISIFKNR
jgi:ABC-type transporter Mla subunit MlaD